MENSKKDYRGVDQVVVAKKCAKIALTIVKNTAKSPEAPAHSQELMDEIDRVFTNEEKNYLTSLYLVKTVYNSMKIPSNLEKEPEAPKKEEN